MEENIPRVAAAAPPVIRGFAPVERNPARVYLAGLGAQTRQKVATKLARFASRLGFASVGQVERGGVSKVRRT